MVRKTDKKEASKEKTKEDAGSKKTESSESAEMLCLSCGKRIEAERFWVEFPCPSCGKEKIIRCEKCKGMENKYTCKKCGFTGP